MPSALAATYRAASRPQEREVDAELAVRGTLPGWLEGTLYRNGPGRLELFGTPYQHLFDGDGMVLRFAFRGGRLAYRNRYVRTRELREEERAGRMLFRSFGTNLPGGLRENLLSLRFKNAANTSVVAHGGRLLALWEGGLPHALDPVTLETFGRFDYAGWLANDLSTIDRLLAPELPFSAHPKVDPTTGELFNFGTAYGRKNHLVLYRVEASGRVAAREVWPLDEMRFVHDFVLTETRRVFFLFPVRFGVARALLGLDSPASSLAPADGPTRIVALDREGVATVREAEAGPGFVFHHAGGYDDGPSRVVVDACRASTMPGADVAAKVLRGEDVTFPHAHLTRFEVDLAGGTTREERLFEHPVELPTIHPGRVGRRHRFVYAIGAAPGHAEPFLPGLVKLDVERRVAVHHDFGADLPGEPVFVPRPGGVAEDDGVVLSVVYRAAAATSELVVLDARDLGEIARAPLPHHVPLGFHGTWVPA